MVTPHPHPMTEPVSEGLRLVQDCPVYQWREPRGFRQLSQGSHHIISLPDGLFMSLNPSHRRRKPAAENTARPPGRGPGRSSGQGQWTLQPAWGLARPRVGSGFVSFPLSHLLISHIPSRMPGFALWTEWPLGHTAEESRPLCPAVGDSGRSWGRPRRRMGTGGSGRVLGLCAFRLELS